VRAPHSFCTPLSLSFLPCTQNDHKYLGNHLLIFNFLIGQCSWPGILSRLAGEFEGEGLWTSSNCLHSWVCPAESSGMGSIISNRFMEWPRIPGKWGTAVLEESFMPCRMPLDKLRAPAQVTRFCQADFAQTLMLSGEVSFVPVVDCPINSGRSSAVLEGLRF
jgi:hypothetical protein